MGQSKSRAVHTTLTKESQLEQRVFLVDAIIEKHVLPSLLIQRGIWSAEAQRFRLACISWSRFALGDELYARAFVRRFPFNEEKLPESWPWRHLWQRTLKYNTEIPGGADACAGSATAKRRHNSRSWLDNGLSSWLTGDSSRQVGVPVLTPSTHIDEEVKQLVWDLCNVRHRERSEPHRRRIDMAGTACNECGNMVLNTLCIGTAKLRPLLRHYYVGAEALIFSIAEDTDIDVAAESVHSILNEPAFLHAGPLAVLVFVMHSGQGERNVDALKLEAFDQGFAPPELGQYNIFMCHCKVDPVTQILEGGAEDGWCWLQGQIPFWKRVIE